ncbi:MAG TPA: hypothetical protein HA298_07150 [Methanobacteriales archaeon]|nr:MAG: hypothetical protein XD44_0328 [Methanobacteriaceae archaeon 41_258]MBC7089067.1 hypothetical protein [Methanobacteriaceae archaeon]MBC7096720.1 hypothetical protein [Methanobacteriales archaeon]HIH62435.1 hypothetical protein [Methanobacteriales archaeon]
MNEKIGGLLALLVALMFAVALGAYDTSSAATADQQVQVSVQEAISIDVDSPVDFGNQSAGDTYNSPNYDISNTGNVKIDLYVNTNDTDFRPTTENTTDTIPIDGNYRIRSNVTGSFEQLSTSLLKIYDNMPKASQGSGTPFTWTTQQQLTIPAFTEDGTYVITLIYTAVKHNVQP